MKKTKHKYYRVTANSMTSFELYMKVPDSITSDDIWMQRGDEILEGSRFKAMDNGWGGCGDWEYDDIHEVDEDEAKEISKFRSSNKTEQKNIISVEKTNLFENVF